MSIERARALGASSCWRCNRPRPLLRGSPLRRRAPRPTSSSWAWAYTAFSDQYVDAERRAAARGAGVHAHHCTPRWEWRALKRAERSSVGLESSRAWVSSLHSCEFFVFGAKIREAFLLGKVTREWRSLVLAWDTLSGRSRLLEIPVAVMVNSCAQEQAFPIAERKTPAFESLERPLYGVLGS